MSEPTPQEAASALYELSQRQQQVAQAALDYPPWLWPALGAVLAAAGVARDLTSDDSWAAQVLLMLPVIALIAVRTKFLGPRLGYRAAATTRARREGLRGYRGRIALAVLIPMGVWGAATALVDHYDASWPNTISGVAFGLAAAFVSPWILSWRKRPDEERHGHVS